ncbi:MAG: RNA-binding protein, partial [Hyphomicrobium sp.]
RALGALSLANKAGLVTTGFEKVEALLSGGRAAALLQGADAAEDGKRKLDRKFAAIQRDSGKAAPVVDWLTIEQLSLAIGRSNVVHAALKQGGATQRFLRGAERLRRYRSGFGAS